MSLEIAYAHLANQVKNMQDNIDSLEHQLAQAHRQGWEQAKMKAVIALGGCNTVEECWDAIAAMEYGGEK